ncbi:MAG: hypothetical protein HYZ15_03355 [Sphingobacteriales bacterium]|nr:hypothetical protein [Sphingobacteriales bacterium]
MKTDTVYVILPQISNQVEAMKKKGAAQGVQINTHAASAESKKAFTSKI